MPQVLSILELTETSISFNTDALNSVLDKVGSRPFSIVSVNGKFRKGKSLLLNFYVQYLQALCGSKANPTDWFQPENIPKSFHWRGGAAPDTTGVNIWSEPFLFKNPATGREICILLLDTQGSFDDKTSTHQNAVVFAISALLASSLVMNVERDVSEEMLQFFRFFTSFAQLALENRDNPELCLEEDSFFQNLTFLVRDFQWYREYPLGLHSDTAPTTNFKQTRLTPNVERSVESNFLREQLALTFDSIGVYLLPHPGDQLAVYDDLTCLNDNFKTYLKEFVQYSFSPKNLTPKRIGGAEVSGTEFKRYVEGWAKLFQGKGSLPTVQSIHDTTATVQNMLAMKDALILYEKGMQLFLSVKGDGVTAEAFQQKHGQVVENCFKIFQSVKRMGGKEYEEKFCSELQTEIDSRFEYFAKINDTKRSASRTKMTLLAKQTELTGKMQKVQQELVNFQQSTSQERAQMETALADMVQNEKELLKQIQEDQADRSSLINEHNLLRNKIAETEAEFAKMQQSQQQYQQQLLAMEAGKADMTRQMMQAGHQHEMEMLQFQNAMTANGKKKKGSWWQAPFNAITMGMASTVVDVFKKIAK